MKASKTTHEGRVALVTGAAQGIGQAIAVALAERGARVIATDLTPPQGTVEKIGPAAHAFQLDVTLEEDWRSVWVQSRDVGDVDIVVNNAGYFPNRSIDELDLRTWRKTLATNLDAHFLSAKSSLPAMRKKKWGRFVGISSNMVGLAIPGMSHYIATKMGIIGFMRGLANDVASDGIDSVLNKRRCRLHNRSGNRRGRRSVSDRLERLTSRCRPIAKEFPCARNQIRRLASD